MLKLGILLQLSAIFVCSGTAHNGIDKHIFKGRDSSIEDFPYIASLKVNGKFQQGATIISPSWALTIASNLSQDAVMTLRSGSASRDAGGNSHFVKKLVIHPQFQADTLDYNFALLEIEPPFMFSNRVAAVALPKQGRGPQPYTKGTVAGWGKLSEKDSELSMSLKSTEVYILGRPVCEMFTEGWINFTQRMLCANMAAEDANPCTGDRGGPLVSSGVLVGLVITDICDSKELISNVYSKVSDQRAWIDSVADTG